MCGICGMATRGEEPSAELLRRMCARIVHRGPDEEGILTEPGIGLGMRRLAIIDLVSGQQPMGNESGDVQVVFNGEIYNHLELRRQLESKGHRFRTRSDTEVIPHLYEEYGLDFAAPLNGIFAIALWDRPRRRLVLARDRAGIKPLFYSASDGRLVFGSELKCLFTAGASARRLHLPALDQFLTFEFTATRETLLDDVFKLPPGSWLSWEHGEARQGTFWNLPDLEPDRGGDEREWAAQLRETLDRAVARQMLSDVPLGAFLSGGIDSSIIVSAMSRASDRPVRTFSIGFANQSYNELPHARRMARHCGTEHHEAILEPAYLSLVEEVIEHLDQPIADFSVFPTLLVSRVAREQVTVVLSGDGGDELFAGYDTYVADRAAHWTVDRLPRTVRRALAFLAGSIPGTEAKKGFRNNLRRFLEAAALPPEWEHMRWMSFLTPDQRRALYQPAFHQQVASEADEVVRRYLCNGGRTRLERQMICDLRFYLPEDILVKVDLMGMAASIENRVPFLDNEVIDLALRIPGRLKWARGQRKRVLKAAYADALPREILARDKQGFSIPLKAWLTREWNGLMHDLLAESTLRRDGLFQPGTVARWMAEHERGAANHSHILWALMVFQLWKARFLDPATAAPAPGGALAALS